MQRRNLAILSGALSLFVILFTPLFTVHALFFVAQLILTHPDDGVRSWTATAAVLFWPFCTLVLFWALSRSGLRRFFALIAAWPAMMVAFNVLWLSGIGRMYR